MFFVVIRTSNCIICLNKLMGDFLSTPNREKHSESGQGGNVRYVATGMQGWRRSMEDAHMAHVNIDNTGVSLFGVFDGHGG